MEGVVEEELQVNSLPVAEVMMLMQT